VGSEAARRDGIKLDTDCRKTATASHAVLRPHGGENNKTFKLPDFELVD